MLKKFLKLSAVLTGVMGFAGVANATISAVGSVGGAASGVTFVNFNTTTTVGNVSSTCPVPPVQTVTLSFTGGSGFFTGATVSVVAPPDLSGLNGNGFGFVAPGPTCGTQPGGTDTTQYIAAVGGGTVTITLPALEQYLGLLWGSVDSYNTITFKNGSTTVKSFTGTDILSGANGDQGTNGTLYVNFNSSDIGSAFNTVVLSSGGNSFEADDLAFNPTPIVKAPEPLTLSLFGAGLAGLGFARRRKARKA